MSGQTKKQFWLYVLTLEEGKHYVGITTQTPQKRFEEHLRGVRYAYWTIKYRPLDILYSEDLGLTTKKEAEAYENKVVRKYMKERGYNNARGGNLKDEEEYTVVLGNIFLSREWEPIAAIIFFTLLFAILGILLLIN